MKYKIEISLTLIPDPTDIDTFMFFNISRIWKCAENKYIHRYEGPAIETNTGHKEYWINGKSSRKHINPEYSCYIYWKYGELVFWREQEIFNNKLNK